MTDSRTHDVVLFGATGFTGRLVAEYLARARRREPFRWAIAGRSREGLEALQRSLSALEPPGEIGLLLADVEDERSLSAMAAATRVVLTTAGPFNRYGEPVAKACVEHGAHYADLAGEPEYADALAEQYDAQARRSGVRVVNSCGFDSIPPDMGVYYTVKQLPRGVPIEIECFVRFDAQFSGGTWTAAVDSMRSHPAHRRQTAQRMPDRGPTAGEGRKVQQLPGRIQRVPERGGWAAPMPTIDPLIVLRSARAMEEYGPDFRYRHSMVFGSLAAMAATGVGIGAGFLAAQLPPTRRALYRMRRPGQGPSEAVRSSSWFEETFVARAADRRLVTRVSGGDPGYDETAKMCGEAALCLALDGDRLPDRAGVLSPAAAMGDALLDRLQAAGLRFQNLEG